MKATAISGSNIALIKYWGKRDEGLVLPMNSSISMTLSNLETTTTVEFKKGLGRDEFILGRTRTSGEALQRVSRHLDLMRRIAKIKFKAIVTSSSNFPPGAGMASSASGFAALTVAGCYAAGLRLGKKELSIIARQGSGSACRSIHGGFVEWKAGDSSASSYAVQIADENHWDVRDLIAVVQKEEKKVSSRAGMQQTVRSSPLYPAWLKTVKGQIPKMRKAILARDFERTGMLAELNSYMMHSTMITTQPPLVYWRPGTLEVIREVQDMQDDGMQAYVTIDAGANVHVLCLPKEAYAVEKRLHALQAVKQVIANRPGPGAQLIHED